MANIPGVNGYTQPGVFARDRVISRGVSIPGGLRIACIMGEGITEETLVQSALGAGQDGSADASPTSSGSGRYFKLSQSPVIKGRTEIYLNGSKLFGKEDTVNSSSFASKFDFRLDSSKGILELQKPSVKDQGGKKYSASGLNVGNGTVIDEVCGTSSTVEVLDSSAPSERWTVRCVAVERDSNGNPIPGRSSFTVTGSESGQIKSSSGSPIIWNGDSFTSSSGKISGSESPCDDGYSLASSAGPFGLGQGVDMSGSGDFTPDTTNKFIFSGNIISEGFVMVGDYLCIEESGGGYPTYITSEIESFSYNSSTGNTEIILKEDVSPVTDGTTLNWEIKATNVLKDEASSGSFKASNVGNTIVICSGEAKGKYKIKAVNSSRIVRLEPFSSDQSMPSIPEDSGGFISSTGATFYMLKDNGVILFGIKEGTQPFEVGDKFFIDVFSRSLNKGDTLEARYIPEILVNRPTLFTDAQDLTASHGRPSLENSLSLGAQMAFENGAPAILAIQCKPPVPRRTQATIIPVEDSDGNGGFDGGTESDDLFFPIPLPSTGLLNGRPDVDTSVNIFVTDKNTKEVRQIFPNKVSFYNSQFENSTGIYTFVSSSDYSYGYTIVNSDLEILDSGFNGELDKDGSTFSTLEVDFDASNIGDTIVVQSLYDGTSNILTTEDDISSHLFGSTGKGAELLISSISSDSKAVVKCASDNSLSINSDAEDVVFYIKSASSTTDTAALLLHQDLVNSGTINKGDGISISYIDENDAEYFDTNWFSAFEELESADCQIVVPLPSQNRFGIFRQSVTHVENMSTISNQRERIAMFGAQRGVTAKALVGLEQIAVEDIGILEGIQGDDPEEVLGENTEDLVNMKVSDNYTGKRSVYFYPDEIIRNINGTNTAIDGFYMAAAAAGKLSAESNVAVPLTYKFLSGFSILNTKLQSTLMENKLGGEGVTVLRPALGGGRILHGRTTSQSGFVEDEEISVVFIRDRVKQVLRDSLKGFLGIVEDQNTVTLMNDRVISIMSALSSQGLVTSFQNVRVERDKVDPRQYNVYLRFQPAYPVNYVFIDIEVGVL